MQKWVIMDAMGVIFKVGDDTKELLVPYIKRLNPEIKSKTIVDLYLKASLGGITSRMFWKRTGLGNLYPKVEINYLNEYLKVNPQTIKLAKRLKKRYKLAILSNDIKEWSVFLCKKFGLIKLFNRAVISGEARARKPALKIFNILQKRLKIKPGMAVLLDDNIRNIKAAINYGLKGILIVHKVKENIKENVEYSTIQDAYNKIIKILI